ncbi:cupin domain-containing protein [Acidithiobacillus sulfuriphilus]|uniref:Cupin domain-containing protein n=1 Tax=Acidithiobacillus sulfuriphilus TaxID=1867749 RepID=A0ACD5HM77_9PROT|nr:cupin domain-containing protein [Acidithiobacillus sulfuriphilus]
MINLEGVVSANWRDLPGKEIFPGIRQRILWQGTNGAKAQILEIDAGAKFTALDTHSPGPEEVFVVSGVFNDGVHDYPAGTFIHHPVGSAHVPQSRQGCVIFVFFPEG